MSARLRRTVRVTRRRTPFLALAIVVVLATATAVSAHTTQGSRATAPLVSGQTTTVFRLAQQDPPDPFDPATLSDNRSIELAQNVFDGLTQINEKDLSIASGLASRFTVSRNGKVYTFALRPGITYQDGRAMTAQDMVYSLNRALNPAVKSQYAFFLSPIKGAQAVADGKAKVVSGVKALGARRVQITLNQPTPYFPALVSMWPYWAVDQKSVDKFGKKAFDPPNLNGTGAFRLVSQVVDNKYVFEANPRYFRGKPKVGRVEVTIVPDPAAQLARYRAGEFDVIQNLDAATYLQVQGDSSLRNQLHSRPILRTVWINMSNDKAPFNNRLVRQAFNRAIDKQALVRIALRGLGVPSSTFLPPGMPGSVAGTRPAIPFNVKLAQQLLARAGYPDGKGFPNVTMSFSSRSDFQAVAEFVQSQLDQNLGVKITLKPRPSKVFNNELGNAATRPPMSLYSFGLDYPDPQEQHEYLGVSGPNGFANYAAYKNPKFDKLIAKANRTVNFKTRMRLHRQAENTYLNDEPIIPLYNPIATWLAKPTVKGFTVTPLYMTRWVNVSVGK
jgi:ABC-type transport system substrate-binding protein